MHPEQLPQRLLVTGMQVEYLLNTGNLGTGSGSNIDLSQASGFTIVAEKLNFFRYVSEWTRMIMAAANTHVCIPVHVTGPVPLCMKGQQAPHSIMEVL